MTSTDTQTQPDPPPPGGYPPISALRRSRTDRHVAGVAGGLGRYAGIDPLIFRILFVVLTFFGGSGILLYALSWLLVPAEGENKSEGQRLFDGSSRSSRSTVLALVVVLVLGLAAVGIMLDTGPGIGGLGALLVVGLIVVLLLNRGQPPAVAAQTPASPTYGPVPPPEPGAYGQTSGTAYATTAPVQPPPPPLPPEPPRERSVLGRATVYVALVVVGLMAGWNTVSGDDFRVVAIFAAALAVVAGGLLVGAFAGRARGLIVLGVLLSLGTALAAVTDEGIEGGTGHREWRPTSEAAAERPFRHGVGEAELDLTRLPAGSQVDVDVRLGVGELRVVVPADAGVDVEGGVGAGVIRLFDEEPVDGTGLDETARSPAAGVSTDGPQITIDAEVGLGELEVRRATS